MATGCAKIHPVDVRAVKIVVELFNVEYYRDLEMWVRVHSRSLKLVPFESLDAVSYSCSIVTMAVSVAVCEISVREWKQG